MKVVLLVEDEPLILLDAAETLRLAGYKVVEAENAVDALRYLREHEAPDALVTDVRMPGSIDGVALAHIVQATCPRTTILICSGHASPADTPEGAMFLPKPYTPTTLVAAVNEAVASRTPQGALTQKPAAALTGCADQSRTRNLANG